MLSAPNRHRKQPNDAETAAKQLETRVGDRGVGGRRPERGRIRSTLAAVGPLQLGRHSSSLSGNEGKKFIRNTGIYQKGNCPSTPVPTLQLVLLCPRPHRAEALSDDTSLTSVAYIEPK